MKKYMEALLAVFLLLGVMLCANAALGTQRREERKVHQSEAKTENPNPPDIEQLEQMGLEPFVSELPILMIDTQNQQIRKDDTIWTTVSVMDDASGKNDILGDADQVLVGALKYRGASSYERFDKKQYRLKFYKKKDGKKLDYDLFGMGADSEWILNGPYLDRSFLRNYLMYHLSADIMDWAPECTFFELFLDGSYQGVYLAIEPITEGAERLRLSKFGLLSGATPYIVKRDREGTEENVLHTYGELNGWTGQQLSVAYPGTEKLITRQSEWIEQDISSFERALYADYFADEKLGYQKYIDVDSFVDYYILNEFAMNRDAGELSTYVYRKLGGKLKLCVWDFNNGFDNYQWFHTKTDQFFVCENDWFDRLIQDRAFVERVVERYHELRSQELSDERIQAILTEGQTLLKDAVDRNFVVWGYTFEEKLLAGTHAGERRNPNSYEDAVELLEKTIAERLAFLDGSIEELYEKCTVS